MKKPYPTHSDDIKLRELLITIWDAKIKIILITVIISATLITNNYYKPKKPDVFENSLEIGVTKAVQFLSFLPIYNYLGQGISNKVILDQFVEELFDYEELIIVLKDVEDIKEEISKLTEQEQQQRLYNYARLFNIKEAAVFYGKKRMASENYVLEFTWGYEGEKSRFILDQALKLTLENLEKSIFFKLDNDYKIKKNKIIKKDLDRIAYLSEQSLIARKLNLEESRVDFYNLSEVQTSFNFNSGGTSPYYLRGYKAIDMEISVIKDREYPQLFDIKKKIDLLKKTDVKWVDYNIFLLDVKLRSHKSTFSPIIVILCSLFLGLLYALISNKVKYYKGFGKKTK